MDIGRLVRPIALVEKARNIHGLPWALVLLGLAAVLALVSFHSAGRLLESPSPRFTFDAFTGEIASAESEVWPEAFAEDIIHSIDGLEVEGEPRRVRMALLALDQGPVALELERRGEKLTVLGSATSHPVADRWAVWSRWVTGCWLLGLGTVVWVIGVVRGRKGGFARYFVALCWALGCYQLVSLIALERPEAAAWSELGSLLLAAGVGVHLSAVNPERLLLPQLAAFFYAPAMLISVVALAAPTSMLAVAVRESAVPWALALAFVGTVLIGRQLWLARQRCDFEALVRARALLVAIFLCFAPPLILTGVFEPGVESMIWRLCFVALSLAMAYAGLRQNLYALDRRAAAFAGHGAAALVLAAASAGLVAGLGKLIGGTEAFRSPLAGAAAAGACFMLFQPLHRHLSRWVDAFFQRQTRDQGIEVRVLQGLAAAVRTQDLPQAFEAAVACLEILEAERTELWARGPDGQSLVCTSRGHGASSAGLDVSLGGALARSLALGSGGVEALADKVLDAAGQDALWDLELALAAPIATSDRLEGFVAVGRKRNGTPFGRQDRLFLEAVATQIAIAFDRNWQRAQRIGAYVLRQRLGTGGMAEVLLAEKQGPGGFGRRVAMKRILPHLAHEKDAIAMFLDEARIAARLHHPNIVQIYDIEEHDRTYYLTMELMSGPSLQTWIRAARDRPDLLPLEASAAVAEALLEALGHVHRSADEGGRALGLVHRDVKPANVLTCLSGDIKLGDFGIARADFRLYQTGPGQSRGTPSYMAPEALFGKDTTLQADLFAAAAVLFETLTLRMAFPKGALKSPLSALPESLGAERLKALDTFFRKALADNPEIRFQDAGDMLAAFHAALGVTPAPRRQLAVWLAEIAASSSPTQVRASRQMMALPTLTDTVARAVH